MDVLRFYRRRGSRILFLYFWAVLLIALPTGWISGWSAEWQRAVLSILSVVDVSYGQWWPDWGAPGPAQGPCALLATPFWFCRNILFAYLVFPLAHKAVRRLSASAARGAFVALLVAAWCYPLLFHFGIVDPTLGSPQVEGFSWPVRILSEHFGLFSVSKMWLGMLAARANIARPLPLCSAAHVWVALACFATLWNVQALLDFDGEFSPYVVPGRAGLPSELRLLSDALMCWLLLCMWAYRAEPAWAVTRSLVRFSKYSYALFLLHVPVGFSILNRFGRGFEEKASGGMGAVDPPAYFAAATASVVCSVAAAILAEESLDRIVLLACPTLASGLPTTRQAPASASVQPPAVRGVLFKVIGSEGAGDSSADLSPESSFTCTPGSSFTCTPESSFTCTPGSSFTCTPGTGGGSFKTPPTIVEEG